MIIYVSYSANELKKTLNSLKKLGLFFDFQHYKNKEIRLKTIERVYSNQKQTIKDIGAKIAKIPTVKHVKLYPLIKIGTVQKKQLQPVGKVIDKKAVTKKPKKKTTPKAKTKAKKPKKEERPKKHLHIFFDIDSTITHEGVDTPHDNVKMIFEKLRKINHCGVYFCTGRSASNVRKLMKLYKTSDYGISENGGIILGIDPEEKGRIGDRGVVTKFMSHLDDLKIVYAIDSDQHPRKTEFVLTQESVDEKELFDAKDSSPVKVEIHASKNTYHISKNKINKGTAILFLTSPEELDLDKDLEMKVAVGDSGLDVPMFEYCDKGYLVGNPSKEVLKKVKPLGRKIKRIKAVGPKALDLIYKDLFPYT